MVMRENVKKPIVILSVESIFWIPIWTKSLDAPPSLGPCCIGLELFKENVGSLKERLKLISIHSK